MADRLRREPNLGAPDDFYEALVAMHAGLSREDSEIANARLVLLLANHLGDLDVLLEAIRAAREGLPARVQA